MELPHRVASDLRRLDSDEARYAERGVRAMVDTLKPPNLFLPWAELHREIDVNGMPGLTICSMLLDALDGEKELDEGELERVAVDARKLLEEVRLADSIPADVLEFIESALVALLKAIDEYWLKGSAAVEQAVDNTIGRAVREHRFEKADGSVRSVLKRLGIILSRLAIVVAVANDLDSLPATVHDVVHEVVHEVVQITDLGRSDIPIPPRLPDGPLGRGDATSDGG
jgi:hypothetical protein